MSSRPGFSVVVGMLSGDRETAEAIQQAIGKTIKRAGLESDVATLEFTDGSKLALSDSGQSCCESRYMTSDDEFEQYVGAKLLAADLRDSPNGDKDDWNYHECQFLVLVTDRGNITFESHVVHNGYYGGFWITACFTDAPNAPSPISKGEEIDDTDESTPC